MSIEAGDIQVKMSLIDDFSNQLKSVNDNLKASTDQWQSNFGAISAATKQVGIAVAAMGAAITGAMTLAIKSFVDTGVAVNVLASQTGMSVVTLQNWQNMMTAAGTNAGSLTMILRTMATSITDMSGNSGSAQKAIESLGLNLKQLQGMSPDQQFNTLTTAISKVTDPTQRLNDATNIFGRSGLALLPVLALGSAEIQKQSDFFSKNVDMTNNEVIAAAKFKVAQTELTGSIKGVGESIVSTLMPVLEPLIKKITDIIVAIENWTKAHPQLTKTITEVVGVLGVAMVVIGGVAIATTSATFAQYAHITALVANGIAMTASNLLFLAQTLVTQGATAAMLQLNAVMSANPIGIVVVAVMALIAVGVLLIKNWQSVQDFFIQFWNVLKVGFADVVRFISDNCLKPLMDGIAAIMDGVADAVGVFSGSWAAAIRGAANDVRGLTNSIDDWTDSIKNNAEADYAAQQKKEVAQKAAKAALKDKTDTSAADTAALQDNSQAATDNQGTVDASSMSLFQDTQDVNDNADAVESDADAFQKDAEAMKDYNSVLAGSIQMMVNGPGTAGESLADAMVTFGNAINKATGGKATTIISSLDGNLNITPTDSSAQAKANANDYGNYAAHGIGGVFDKEHVARVAEKGRPEAIVPLNSDMTPDSNGLSVLSRLNLASIKMPSLNTDSFRPVTGLASAGAATTKLPDSMNLRSEQNITLKIDGQTLMKFVNQHLGKAVFQRKNG